MLTAGVIGMGFAGLTHSASIAAMPGARLAAVVDVEAKKRSAGMKYFDVPGYSSAGEMLKREAPDIVVVGLPTYMHCRFTVLAARFGCHVFCEKPMATSLAEADRMIGATERAGVLLMIGNVLRFWPEYQYLKKTFDAKKLGRLRSLQMSRLSPMPMWSWQNWLNKQDKSMGIIDLHMHDTDFIRYLLGEPKRLSSSACKHGGGWRQLFTNFDYPGVSAAVEAVFDLPPRFPFTMSYRAVFERGALVYDCNAAPTLTLYPEKGKPRHPRMPAAAAPASGKSGAPAPIGAYYDELRYFVDCIRRGQKPAVTTARDSRTSLALAFREMQSPKRNYRSR